MKPIRQEFSDERIPLGYLVTIRAYGTWLHGSAGSVDRFHNTYGTPKLPANKKRKEYNRRLLAQEPVRLGTKTRRAVELAIRETCEIRKWTLWAFNVRSNHVHSVVSAKCKPKRIVTAFKANATRKMREDNTWQSERSPWVGGGGSRSIFGTKKPWWMLLRMFYTTRVNHYRSTNLADPPSWFGKDVRAHDQS